MIRPIKLLGLFAYSFLISNVRDIKASQLLVDEANVIRYARLLSERREFKSSAEEYYRAITYFPHLVKDHDLVETMFQMAEQSGDYFYALSVVNQLDASAHGEVGCLSQYYRGKSLYRLRRYGQAKTTFETFNNCPDRIKNKNSYFEALALMRLREWDHATAILLTIKSFPDKKKVESAISLAKDGRNIHYRSPRVASFLSTIFPGAGYAYAGSFRSSIAALITIGLLSWGSFALIDSDNSGAGALLATFAFSWHLGSVYGSSKSANRYNSYLSDRRIDPLEIQ